MKSLSHLLLWIGAAGLFFVGCEQHSFEDTKGLHEEHGGHGDHGEHHGDSHDSGDHDGHGDGHHDEKGHGDDAHGEKPHADDHHGEEKKVEEGSEAAGEARDVGL